MKKIAQLAFVTLTLSTVACNGTTRAVCNEDNATQLVGVTGDYTLSFQKEDYSVETKDISIHSEPKGLLRLSGRALDGDTPLQVCNVRGKVLVEAFDKGTAAYSQAHVAVTGSGISFYPIQFDKLSLDAAGIPSEVVEWPEFIPHNFKSLKQKMFGADTYLRVINDGVSSERLFKSATSAPVGLTLFRK